MQHYSLFCEYKCVFFQNKSTVHCPGIEPGSQEWESCMIPLHQQCYDKLIVKNGTSRTTLK